MTNLADDNYNNNDFQFQWDDQEDSELSYEQSSVGEESNQEELDVDEPSFDSTTETPDVSASEADSDQDVDSDSDSDSEDATWFEDHSEQSEDADQAVTTHTKDLRGRTANRNTLILLLACIVAVAGIYLLGLTHKTSEEEHLAQQTVSAELDLALNRLLATQNEQVGPDGITDNQRLMQAFYQYPGNKQLHLDELQCNPFQSVDPIVSANQQQIAQERVATDRRILRLQELTTVFDRLSLDGILIGPGGQQCMINGEVFNQGDTVNQDFTIEAITPQEVLLIAEQTEFVLQM